MPKEYQSTQLFEQPKHWLAFPTTVSYSLRWHLGGCGQVSQKTFVRVSKGVMMTFDENTTLLCRIEEVLNSRPITSLSNDPSEFNALTAGHFLIGGPLQLPPEPDYTGMPQKCVHRFKLMQAQAQSFWKRWSSEYFPQCQRRCKWTKLTRNIEVGHLEILRNDNNPPLQWDLVPSTSCHVAEFFWIWVQASSNQGGCSSHWRWWSWRRTERVIKCCLVFLTHLSLLLSIYFLFGHSYCHI